MIAMAGVLEYPQEEEDEEMDTPMNMHTAMHTPAQEPVEDAMYDADEGEECCDEDEDYLSEEYDEEGYV